MASPILSGWIPPTRAASTSRSSGRSGLPSPRAACRKATQLPTVRQLAVELRVNANTVAKVYSDLEREGVVETRRGVGTFVAERVAAPSQHGAIIRRCAISPPACSRTPPRAAFRAKNSSPSSRLQLKEENRCLVHRVPSDKSRAALPAAGNPGQCVRGAAPAGGSRARLAAGDPASESDVADRRRRRSAASCALSPRVANQWERAIVLRLGRYIGSRGPACSGSFRSSTASSAWIDQRTITTSFDAEQTLTSDTVPVNVDAVLFWVVHDPEKAALEVQDYANAVSWRRRRRCATSSAARRSPNCSAGASASRPSCRSSSISDRTRGASRCSRSRCATSSFPGRCRTRCRGKRRHRARNRRASSWLRPKRKLPRSSRRRRSRT